MHKDRYRTGHPDLVPHSANASVAARGGHVGLVVSCVVRSRPEPRGVAGLVREYRYHAPQATVVGAPADSAGYQRDSVTLSLTGGVWITRLQRLNCHSE